MSTLSPEWIPLLKKVFFFSEFNEKELHAILGKMRLISLPKGAVLFRQGDDGDALYQVTSGRLRVTQAADGQEKPVAYLGRGESLGEMSLLTGEPRANTAHVDATAELLVLYRKDFEPLLRSVPSMAVHIAHVLSRRLLETTRTQAAAPSTARLYPLLPCLDFAEAAVFVVNLAISLVEQTRRKVLVLDVYDRDEGLCAKALGLSPVRVSEGQIRQEDLQNPAVVQRLTVFHPSGLELISLPTSLMEGKLFNAIYPFLALLRQNYDITLIAMPPRVTPFARAVMDESDRVVTVEKDPLAPDAARTLATLAEALPAEKLFRVRLMEGAAPPGGPPASFRLPWNAAIGREFLDTRTPFVLKDRPIVQRHIDRLARDLGGLRIGFAMGSGAAFGYVLIGMLKVLERNGIHPDIIAGTSMGALIGSFYAAGRSTSDLEEIALSITKKKLLSLADITLPWQGLLIGREVLRFLKSVLGEVTFEELPLPFTCVATDITTGEEVVLRQGKVAEAVRGSLSLPFFFQPHFHEGRFLVDGGLVNPVPTSVVASMGANVLISANMTTKPTQKRMPGRGNWRRRSSSYWKGPNIVEIMAKTIYTMQYEIAKTRSGLAHVVLEPDLSEFTWSEFYKAADIIKIGEDCMEESLPKIKSLLPFFADYCRVPLRPKPPASSY